MDYITIIAVFFAMQLVNVVLNTLKILVMQKSSNTHVNALINAVTYGFYYLVVKQVTEIDAVTMVVVTVITNFIGVYVSYAILNRVTRDDLWKVEIYSKAGIPTITQELDVQRIGYVRHTAQVITAYCYTQEQSKEVKEILKTVTAKVNITPVRTKL